MPPEVPHRVLPATSPASRFWRIAAVPVVAVVAALVLAILARHQLVEPADLTARCDAAPWEGVDCALRTLTVQAFAAQRLGTLALAAAALATLARWRALAIVALAAGSAGLVLYSTLLSAPAVLLAALVLARPAGGRG
jgi:hypothetical protein